MPSLDARPLPKILEQVDKQGSEIITEWLADGIHRFVGREWKPFAVKPKDRGNRKAVSKQNTDDPDPSHRVYFFACDGTGFRKSLIPEEICNPHVKIPIDVLLNFIRPTERNDSQGYLKFFARTRLGKPYFHYQKSKL